MIQSWSFRKKIGVILVLFTFIPSILMQQLMMHFYEDHIIEKASRNIYSVVRANNNVLRMMLNQIEDISQLMLNNEYYYEVAEFLNLIQAGERESSINSHDNSLITLEIIDEIRRQLGIVYPADK